LPSQRHRSWPLQRRWSPTGGRWPSPGCVRHEQRRCCLRRSIWRCQERGWMPSPAAALFSVPLHRPALHVKQGKHPTGSRRGPASQAPSAGLASWRLVTPTRELGFEGSRLPHEAELGQPSGRCGHHRPQTCRRAARAYRYSSWFSCHPRSASSSDQQRTAEKTFGRGPGACVLRNCAIRHSFVARTSGPRGIGLQHPSTIRKAVIFPAPLRPAKPNIYPRRR
jgi:hypothetical protein